MDKVRTKSAAIGLFFGLVLIVPAREARADSCQTVANTTAKVWKNTPAAVKQAIAKSGPYGATAIAAIKLIATGVKIWNMLAKDDSWARIGPRRMDFDAWQDGTLVGISERMFISGIPAVNPVEIEFKKLDRNGKAKVVVCEVPENGKARPVTSFVIDKEDKDGETRTVKIDGAKGKIITVVLHGKNATKSLKYKLRARMIYEDEK
ncbi:MAG: hypothetical protein R3B13_06800 [Polyangiaceae bacterium]